MFRFIKRAFIALLSFNGSLPTKCILLNNQLCMKRPFLFYINPDELIQGLRHYPLIVSLDKCDEIYVPNKTEDVDVKVFNMSAEINEAQAFIKTFHVFVNVHLIIKDVMKMINGMEISVDTSAKSEWNIVCPK